jgi:hypothetical protein
MPLFTVTMKSMDVLDYCIQNKIHDIPLFVMERKCGSQKQHCQTCRPDTGVSSLWTLMPPGFRLPQALQSLTSGW